MYIDNLLLKGSQAQNDFVKQSSTWQPHPAYNLHYFSSYLEYYIISLVTIS